MRCPYKYAILQTQPMVCANTTDLHVICIGACLEWIHCLDLVCVYISELLVISVHSSGKYNISFLPSI